MYLQTHWNLLESRRGSELRLTKIDEEIYLDFRDKFPDLDVTQPLDEDLMKGKDKEKWRKFMVPYENRVKDFNFGTMLRRDPKTEYGEKETIFGMPTVDVYLLCSSSQPYGCSSSPLKLRGRSTFLLSAGYSLLQKQTRSQRLDLRGGSKVQSLMSGSKEWDGQL
jgi:hypothetical protein